MAQVKQARDDGVPAGIVLADPAYGDSAAFRDKLLEMRLRYAVGIRSNTRVWALGVAPLPREPTVGAGRPRKNLRRAPGHAPESVKALALALPPDAYLTVAWREGSNETLSSRFAAVRIRTAHRDYWRSTQRPEEWLLIEWPEGDGEPLKYFLSTLPVNTAIERLVHVTKMRWRIERDYRELKQEFGLGHYEGRSWRGLHHHATLCIAAYAFLLHHRLSYGSKKNPCSTTNACITRKLPTSWQREGRSAMCRIRSLRFAFSSLHASPGNFYDARVVERLLIRLGEV